MRLGWKLPLERLSPTSMAKFASCPESFRQKYLIGTKEAMHGARFMGIVDHATMEEAFKVRDAFPDDALTDLDVEMIYQRQWNTTLDEHGEEVVWKDTTADKQYEIGLKMMKAYAVRVLPNVKPVALEERIEFRVDGVPSKIIGYIDILEADRAREKKTTAAKTTKPKPEWRFQGLVYQAATGLPTQWDIVTRQVTPQVYTIDECPELWMPLRDMRATLDLIRDTAWYMNDCFTRFGADNPWPRTGVFRDWACSYCPIGIQKGDGSCSLWTP